MESHLPRTQGHHYEESDLSDNPAEVLNSGVEGNIEGHQEKPSMLKRMKAKAKKIRNTLTGHGHGHDHDHDRDHSHSQSHDEYEEEEEEEMVEDPEIHGAPIYEAAGDKGAAPASDRQSASGGTNLDRPSMVDPHDDSPVVDTETRPFVERQADRSLVKDDEQAPVPCKLVELPHKGINTRTGRDVYEETENPDQVGGPNANYQVDPQAPDIRVHPSNVQIKTIDPAGRGSEEAEGITPVLKSFNKMGISEEKTKPEQGNGAGLYTGSHNQFDPEPVPSESCDSLSKGYNADNPLDISSSGSSESFPKSYNAANPRDTPEDVFDPASQSSTYTEKITSASSAASSAIAGTAQSAKNAVASKIGQMREPGEDIKPEEDNNSGSVMGTAKGVSREEYLVEKLKPGEEEKALSSMITEKPNGEKMEEVSDAVHKRGPEGKVTESEEVAKGLGTGEEGSEVENVGSGGGMVSMLTGAIGSWFGGAQSTPVTNLADDNEGDMGKKNTDAQGVAAERRLEE